MVKPSKQFNLKHRRPSSDPPAIPPSEAVCDHPSDKLHHVRYEVWSGVQYDVQQCTGCLTEFKTRQT